MGSIVSFIQDLVLDVMIIAWLTFFLTWSVGWALKGSPIPFLRVKRTGYRFIEDAVWAAFWLAMGSTVFALIAYVTAQVQQPFPPPPAP